MRTLTHIGVAASIATAIGAFLLGWNFAAAAWAIASGVAIFDAYFLD